MTSAWLRPRDTGGRPRSTRTRTATAYSILGNRGSRGPAPWPRDRNYRSSSSSRSPICPRAQPMSRPSPRHRRRSGRFGEARRTRQSSTARRRPCCPSQVRSPREQRSRWMHPGPPIPMAIPSSTVGTSTAMGRGTPSGLPSPRSRTRGGMISLERSSSR